MDGAPRHLDPVTGPEHPPRAVEIDGELALAFPDPLILFSAESPERAGGERDEDRQQDRGPGQCQERRMVGEQA